MINKKCIKIFICATVISNTLSAQNLKIIAKTHATFRTTGSYTEDSTHYFHSGTKTSSQGKYKIPEFQYMEDSMYSFVYNTNTKALELDRKRISTYSGADFNESIEYKMNTSGKWEEDIRTTIKYSGGKPDTVFYDKWIIGTGWRGSTRIIYTWSGNNIATRIKQRSFTGINWFNNRKWTYKYNGNNETEYVDAKWFGTNWFDTMKRETKYTTGKVSQTKTFKGAVPVDSSTYTYDGNSRLVQKTKYVLLGTTWEGRERIIHFYHANNATPFPDTTTYLTFLFGTYVNEKQWYFSYLNKTDGRYTSANSLSWDGVSKWKQTDGQDSLNVWNYGWNLAINEVDIDKNMIKIYPSPASNTINITLDNINNGKQLYFTITDMQGRLIKNWTEQAHKTTTTMSINELSAGNYLLQINMGTQTVSKQFVVNR